MGARGFEPRTSPLSGVRSSRLSYAPESRRAFHCRISSQRVNGLPVKLVISSEEGTRLGVKGIQ